MARILGLNRLIKELAPLRDKKRIGLVTGCFDVVHLDHIKLFRFAKKHVDILIVGVDTDLAIKLTKGENRPINNQQDRLKFLAELCSVDFIFPLRSVHHFSSKEANEYYDRIAIQVKPHYIITAPDADKHSKLKEERATKAGSKLLKCRKRNANSTTNIVNRVIKADL